MECLLLDALDESRAPFPPPLCPRPWAAHSSPRAPFGGSPSVGRCLEPRAGHELDLANEMDPPVTEGEGS